MSEERKTTKYTDVCIPCGYVFTDADDYDTLGSDSGVLCPACGREKFVSVKTIIEQRDDLLAACEFAKAQIKKGSQKKALPILRAAIAKAESNENQSKQSVEPVKSSGSQ